MESEHPVVCEGDGDKQNYLEVGCQRYQFEYAFDDIGNRTGVKAGGNADGGGLRSASYTANYLNQYSQRTVPGAVDVMGASFATNTVLVNNQTAYRKGEYFRKELAVNNTAGPVQASVSVAASGQTTVSGNVLLAPALEQFAYDADGNLLQDGLWTYTWDGENRLVASERQPTAWLVPPVFDLAPKQLLGVRGLATRQVRHLVYSSERSNAGATHIPRCPGQPPGWPKRCCAVRALRSNRVRNATGSVMLHKGVNP